MTMKAVKFKNRNWDVAGILQFQLILQVLNISINVS